MDRDPTEVDELTIAGFRAAVDYLVMQVKDKGFTSVFGIPKGGLMLAVTLANKLELPLLLNFDEVDASCLVCDDIVDSGATIMRFGLEKNFVVTLHYKKNSAYEPNLWCYEKKEKWIRYPWE